jgi:hypothetical protein
VALKSDGQSAARSDQQEAVAEDESEIEQDVLCGGPLPDRPPMGEDLAHAMGAGGELKPEHPSSV